MSHGTGKNRTRILIGLPSPPGLESQKFRAKRDLRCHLVQPLTLQVVRVRAGDRSQGQAEGPERAGMGARFPDFEIQLLSHTGPRTTVRATIAQRHHDTETFLHHLRSLRNLPISPLNMESTDEKCGLFF